MMNANNPQTPGVYTVEKNAFPNAVAQVPTAIPAFIGYTEMAMYNGKPLTTPLLVNSLAEYQKYFGGPFTSAFPVVTVEPITNPITNAKTPPTDYDFEINDKYYLVDDAGAGLHFYMYNCLQLFYQNGGGPCYIMSIGNYQTEVAATPPLTGFVPQTITPTADDFISGLTALTFIQSPKPTMILTPDALLLEAADYFTVQQQALMQCGELEDRVALIDVFDGEQGLESGVIASFRNQIGNNYLKYGISYYPFLETTVVEASDVTYANVDQNSTYAEGLANHVTLSTIFPGQPALAALAQITADITSIQYLAATPPFDFGANATTFPTTVSGSDESYPSWSVAFNAFPATATPTAMLQWQLRVAYGLLWTLYELGNKNQLTSPSVKISNTSLQTAVKNMTSVNGNLISLLIGLYAFDANYKPTDDTSTTSLGVLTQTSLGIFGITADMFNKNPSLKAPASPYGTNTTSGSMFPIADNAIKSVFNAYVSAMGQVSKAAQTLLSQYNSTMESKEPNYKTLMSAIAKKAGTLPPCSAMAGVYTLVDNSEGVWIAPANRNINSVTAPTVSINNDQQASLNVDVIAGKSINAIRSFFGRGPAIIWGARTLDGNSLDWRYINVRRTVIMIEQSVKNAAESMVFQSNNSSTWNRMEGMIDNFLHGLWMAGALQGATAASAYNVSVGLGKTMTPQDILDGIMRVQVKLAVVRPAEFIIITYEQEMATS